MGKNEVLRTNDALACFCTKINTLFLSFQTSVPDDESETLFKFQSVSLKLFIQILQYYFMGARWPHTTEISAIS